MPVEFDEQKSFGSSYLSDAQHTGIIGFLIRKGVVKDEKHAEMVLLVVAIVAFALAICIYIPTLDFGPVHSGIKAPSLPSGATPPTT